MYRLYPGPHGVILFGFMDIHELELRVINTEFFTEVGLFFFLFDFSQQMLIIF